MKALLKIVLLLAIVFGGWAAWTYPKVGELAFEYGALAESKLYGLSVHRQNVGDVDLVYYRGGQPDAETIVMIHGYTADKNVWPRFAKHFTADYQVIIPDLAGHGETAYSAQGDYSITAQAARVAALLDRLGIAKAHIIGNSMGGITSAYFAIHYPEKTLSATMLDPAGVVSPIPSDMEKMLAKGENPFLIESVEDFKAFYPMSMANPPYLPGFVLDAIAQKYMSRRERHAHIFDAIRAQPLLTNELSQLKAPALLIWGSEDRLIHVSSTQVWAAGVPQLQVEIFKGIGHMPMVEDPQRTARRYREFLSSIQ